MNPIIQVDEETPTPTVDQMNTVWEKIKKSLKQPASVDYLAHWWVQLDPSLLGRICPPPEETCSFCIAFQPRRNITCGFINTGSLQEIKISDLLIHQITEHHLFDPNGACTEIDLFRLLARLKTL